MTYGIFSLESGNALAWFASQDEALDAVRQIIEGEPDAIDAVGLMEFDDRGHPSAALQGQELVAAARAVAA